MKKQMNNIMAIIMLLGSITLPIFGSILHFYTVYLNSIESGFLSGFISFCLPVISEVWYAIDEFSLYGFSSFYVQLIIIYIVIFILVALSSYALERDYE